MRRILLQGESKASISLVPHPPPSTFGTHFLYPFLSSGCVLYIVKTIGRLFQLKMIQTMTRHTEMRQESGIRIIMDLASSMQIRL